MKNVLILCTGNSCRSQIAEGYIRHFAGTDVTVYSAGIETHGVNPRAIETMKEDGVDISAQTSNNVNEYTDLSFDYIITVCDNAKENCPYFPSSAHRFHHSFPDPAGAKGTETEIMAQSRAAPQFASVRDLIKEYSKQFVQKNGLY